MIALVHIDGDDIPIRFRVNSSYGPGIGDRIEILEPELSDAQIRTARRELEEGLCR